MDDVSLINDKGQNVKLRIFNTKDYVLYYNMDGKILYFDGFDDNMIYCSSAKNYGTLFTSIDSAFKQASLIQEKFGLTFFIDSFM